MTSPIQSLYNWYRATIRNPKYRWWIVLGTFAYLVSPFDLILDFIPIIGELDDALLITLLFTEISQLVIERLKARRDISAETFAESAQEDTNSVDVNAVVIE